MVFAVDVEVRPRRGGVLRNAGLRDRTCGDHADPRAARVEWDQCAGRTAGGLQPPRSAAASGWRDALSACRKPPPRPITAATASPVSRMPGERVPRMLHFAFTVELHEAGVGALTMLRQILAACTTAGLCCAPAIASGGPLSLVGYVQYSQPAQTETNRQIADINMQLGTHLRDWHSVSSFNAGFMALWQMGDHWRVGPEVDLGFGGLKDSGVTETLYGPANASFEQEYSPYLDVLAVGQFHALPGKSIDPFVVVGVGGAYDRDVTKLTVSNDLFKQEFRVPNRSLMPLFTAGVGADVRLANSTFVELAAGYTYAMSTNTRDAEGDLLPPGSTVRVVNDLRGPYASIGLRVDVGRR